MGTVPQALKAILFDVDGTLADTERDGHRPAFNQAFADAGLDWNWDIALYGELLAVTGGRARIRRYIDDRHPGFSVADDLDDFIAGLHRAKTAHYTALVRDQGLPLRPGVKRLLEQARGAGVRLAIATTTTRANVDALLDRHRLNGVFEVIGAADVVPVLKPEPDVYLYTMTQLGLTASECLAVEDSRNGIRASLAAALPTLITVNGYTRGHDFSGAALVVDSLGEPDHPFTVLAGDAHGHSLVDIALADQLVAAVGVSA